MSDRLLAERLQASFKALIEAANDGIISADSTGAITLFNRAAERMFGYSAREVLGKTLTTLMPERFHDAHRAGFNRYLSTGEARVVGKTVELAGKRKDGTEFPLELSLASWKTQGETFFTAIIRDISRRKEMEERLHQSEERSRALVDQVKDYAILMLDPQGRVLTWNQGAELIKGFKAEEIIGRSITCFYTPEEIAENRPQRLLEAAAAQASVQDEGWRVRKDGSRFWADVTISALRDPQGTPTGFVKITRDATRRLRAEEKVQEHAAELTRANKELETFSYSVSHDLRAPLRAIDGFSQILEETLASKLDEQDRHYLERIRGASHRMGELIDDLLGLSRVSRGELTFQEVNFTSIAEDVANELRTSAPERAVEFVIAPGMKARGDARLLKVLLENLLGNSWKFTSKHARARIEVGTIEKSGKRAFFVRDDGVGFDMAYAGKLFGPFQRLHDPQEFEGTGIGLATVHRIVQRHGGTIWAESEVEKGATFYFTLGS